MKILILTQWYPPEPALLLQELAQTLQAKGHDITVLTGFPNYPSGKLYPDYRLRLYQREAVAGVAVVRVPLYPDHSDSGIRRVLNYMSFALSSAFLGTWLTARPDVIFVYHPPLTIGLPAFVLSRLWRVPFVYQVQDMWPETLAATGMMPSQRVARWVSRLARFVYRRAVVITVISPGFKRNLVEKGVPPEKIHVIPNWADEDIYRLVPRDEALAARHSLTGRFNIVFGGNMGAAQGLQNVIEAATLLRDTPEVQFVLIGDGIDKNVLCRMVQQRNLDNVRFLERQPAAEMPRFYALADALLVHLKRDPLFEITIPSKTLAYLACGRPIVGVVSGDPADVIRQAGAGIICPQEDPAAMAQTVRKLYDMIPEEREVMGERGRQAFLEHYTRAVLVERYEALFEAVVRERGGR